MRIRKRIGTIIMAIIMLSSLSITALADEIPTSGSITIHKYEVEDLDDYTFDGTGEQLDDDYQVDSNGTELGDLTPLDGITFKITQVVPNTGKVGSTDVDDYEEMTGGYTAEGQTSAGTITWNNLAFGYYLIEEVQGPTTQSVAAPFIVALPMTNPAGDGLIYNVHVYPKNEIVDAPPIEKESVTDPSNGNVISWKYTVGIPGDIKGAQKLVIKDLLDSRLTYIEDSIEGCYTDDKGNEHDLTVGTHYTLDYDDDTKTLTITIKDDGFEELAKAFTKTGTEIPQLFFSFKTEISDMDDENSIGEIENGGEIEYTNSEGYEFKNEIDEDDKPKEDLFGLEIYKVDALDGKELEGARFELYIDGDCKVKAYNGVIETDDEGLAYVYGLVTGTYYLKEIKAPEGYNLISPNPAVVTISKTAATDYIVQARIPNNHGFTLPKTGGIGTLLFTLGGLVLIGAACVILIAYRKKKVKKNIA